METQLFYSVIREGGRIMKIAIIFGLGPAGLFLGRQLAENNVKVIGIGRHDDVGLYSNKIEGFVAETASEIKKIVAKVAQNSSCSLNAYICSDQYLTLLLEEYRDIFNELDFQDIKIEVLELINSKKQINKYCNGLGINSPRSIKYSEIENKENLEFPLIFKLDTKKINAPKNPIGKIKIIRNEIEFHNLMIEIEKDPLIKDEIVIQSYIDGDNSNQYSYGGYFKGGNEVAGIVVNQIRQFPQGVSCFVVETVDCNVISEITKHVTRFAEGLSYSGFLEMEFKLFNNTMYLMDINPRPWGWVSILGRKYSNFHQLLDDKDVVHPQKNESICTWKSPIRDFISYLKPSNNARYHSVSNAFKVQKAYDIYDLTDLLPSIGIIIVGLKKIIKKVKR